MNIDKIVILSFLLIFEICICLVSVRKLSKSNESLSRKFILSITEGTVPSILLMILTIYLLLRYYG